MKTKAIPGLIALVIITFSVCCAIAVSQSDGQDGTTEVQLYELFSINPTKTK